MYILWIEKSDKSIKFGFKEVFAGEAGVKVQKRNFTGPNGLPLLTGKTIYKEK